MISDKEPDIPIPGAAEFEKWVKSTTKQTFLSYLISFKRKLTTAAEPFHRKNTGERYFSKHNMQESLQVWLVFSGLNCLAWYESSERGFVRKYFIVMSIVTGLLLCGAVIFYAFQSEIHSLRRRQENNPMHSRSRGVPRFGKATPLVIIGIILVLMVTNQFAALAFVVSLYMASKIASQQQEAIRSRYMDEVDRKIENEQLEGAILGNSPVEETFLHEALPKNLPEEVRRDMAAAAVGKKLTFMAKHPVARHADDTSDIPPSGGPVAERSMPAAQPRKEPQPSAQVRTATRESEEAAPIGPKTPSSGTAAPKSKESLRIILMVFMIIAIIVLGIVGLKMVGHRPHRSMPVAGLSEVAQPQSATAEKSQAPRDAPPSTAGSDNAPVYEPALGNSGPRLVSAGTGASDHPTATHIPVVIAEGQDAFPPKPVVMAAEANAPATSSPVAVVPAVAPDVPPAKPPEASSVPEQVKPVVLPAVATSSSGQETALNDFSNFCYAAIAAENGKLQNIQNINLRMKLSSGVAALQVGASRIIARHQGYLHSGVDQIREMEMARERSLMSNTISRFDDQLRNAALLR